jgi:chromate transporter
LTSPVTQRPSLWLLFRTLLTLGIQSFGGGSTTFLLIQRACVGRGWLSEEEFVRTWALAQISPGINLLKLTVMVGYRLRGWPGVAAAVTGLLLPSAGATALMTAGFSAIRGQPMVQAAMKGVLPATIGLSLAMAYQMAQPLFVRGYKEGPLRLSASLLIVLAAALGLGLADLSPVLALLLAGGAGVLLMAWTPLRAWGRQP